MDIQSVGSANVPVQRSASGPSDGAASVRSASTQAVSAAATQQAPAAASAGQVSEAVKSINEALKSLSPDLQFSVDSESNRTIVKVVDQQTQEVIRQMPTAEALEIAKALDKVQGLIIRQKA